MESFSLDEREEYAGQQIFNSNCRSCHRAKTKLIGPPLGAVVSTKSRDWIEKMIRDADGMVASGDKLAVQVWKEYGRQHHVRFRGFTKKEMDELFSYLKSLGEPVQ